MQGQRRVETFCNLPPHRRFNLGWHLCGWRHGEDRHFPCASAAIVGADIALLDVSSYLAS
jgi:hypothetical protein